MIAVVDYGAGNLYSVVNALNYIGERSEVTNDASEIKRADAMVLPGVGAFPDAMKSLLRSGLYETVRKESKKKPLLGICLGMQMFFDRSFEIESCDGLSLIPGEVRKIPCGKLKIPHMGWNSLEIKVASPLFSGVPNGSYVYFVHSYMAFTDARNVLATAGYGTEVTAAVTDGRYVFGTQFHPEKSGETGLMILRNFGRLA